VHGTRADLPELSAQPIRKADLYQTREGGIAKERKVATVICVAVCELELSGSNVRGEDATFEEILPKPVLGFFSKPIPFS
jgi:hypothetical protein